MMSYDDLTPLAPRRLIILGLVALAAGCAGDDDPEDPMDDVGDASESGDPASSDAGDAPDPYDCVETDPQASPLFGPGWDSENDVLLGDALDTYLVHSTQALVMPEYVERFDALSTDVVDQLMTTPGLVAVGFLQEPNCGFARTLGIWESEEAMYRFVGSGAHARAMAETQSLRLSGRVTHFEVTADELPVPWEVVLEHIGDVEPFGR